MTEPFVINGCRIHSRYNPDREASRFINNWVNENGLTGRSSDETIILSDPGTVYLYNALKTAVPEHRIFILFYSDMTKNNLLSACPDFPADNFWVPSSGISSFSFLISRISEWDISKIRVLSWPPMDKAFPERASLIQNDIKNAFLYWNKNLLTTGGFGRTWINNTFKNFLFLEEYYNFPEVNGPLVIAASGPTLTELLEPLKKNRKKYILWALPSSLSALKHFEIIPDLIISADSGYYATWHYREFPGQMIPAAFPLSAAASPLIGPPHVRPVLFQQGLLPEKEILARAGIIVPFNSQNGTIAGTALQLALGMKVKEIYFAGLDFCFRDISAHAKPHTFDLPVLNSSLRTKPFEAQLYERAFHQTPEKKGAIRTGAVLDVYSAWFRHLKPESDVSLFRLNPTPVPLPELKNATFDVFREKEVIPETAKGKAVRIFQKEERIKIIRTVISRWMDLIEKADSLDIRYHNSEVFDILSLIETADVLKMIKHSGYNGKEWNELQEKSCAYCRELLEKYAG